MKMPLRIYNRFLDFQAEIDTYQSLQFGRDFHGVANFELHINRYMHETKHLEKGNLVALNKQRNKVGIILTKEIALDDSGKDSENFKLTGYTIDGIIGRRLTVPPGHTSHDRKSGNAETVMKHYVCNHFVNPVDPSRKMPHIEVAPDLKRGEHIEWESRYNNVADELETISIKTGLGWGLFANFKTKKLIFDVIEAKDLTQDNPYGNHPVFFSPEFETIKSQGFINSDNDLRNVGYIGGQGEGAEREIITLGNNVGWDRIETFIDARDVGSTVDEELSPEEVKRQLTERGQSKMRDMASIYTLEAEILTPSQESPFQYGEDFDLGDKVQVVNKSWGLQMTAPITHFKEIYEVSGFRLEATFGRSRPTLHSKMKSKFDELQGVEKQELPALIAVETKQYTNRKMQQEEQERIKQAQENLEKSIKHIENYAEKKRVESETPPEDKTVIWVDISDPDNVIWKIWDENSGNWKAGPSGPQGPKGDTGPRGVQGLQGPKGNQGIKGETGEDGRTAYTHIAYADDEDGKGFSYSPTNKAYIGVYADHTSADSDDPSDYNWTLIKGADGSQGLPGPKGEDGRTPYFHTAWANNSSGTSGFSTTVSDGKLYIGTYTDFTSADSTSPSRYSWTRIKGDQGPQGNTGAQGPKGDTGSRGPTGPQGPNIVDSTTQIEANVIRSNHINVSNLSSIVADLGTVTAGTLKAVDIEANNFVAKDGDFFLEDNESGVKYSATPKRNIVKDHSFELVKHDPDSMGSTSVKYNWLEMRESGYHGENIWMKTGSPKVAMVFGPDSRSALPIFGEKAICVRDANFVRQVLYDGIAGGMTFTASGFFKRQHNVVAGGKPRFEIDHLDAAGGFIRRLSNTIFPAVPDDYSVVRHSLTFTIPNDFAEGDSLDFKISGGNNEWVQCDGIQIVEGTSPSVYMPEDSTWEIAKGSYNAIGRQPTLWAGNAHLRADDTIYPAKPITDCRNGWIFVWGYWSISNGSVGNSDWQFTHIPKHPDLYNGGGHRTGLRAGGSNLDVVKYYYIHHDRVVGHNLSYTGDNRYIVLREILEY